MHKIMEELHLDHIHLTKVFHILDQQVSLMSSGDNPDFFLMADIAHYIKHYPDLFHHPKEDRVYKVFKEKTSEANDVVLQLQTDHKQLPNETNELYNILKAATNSVLLISRDELKDKTQLFLELERKHMELEERVVFPLIKEILTEEDWSKIDVASLNKNDPLFGDNIEACYENLYRSIKSQGGVE